MQILVDADACPLVGIVESLAEKYNIPTTLLCDTNHVLYSDYSDVIIVGACRYINCTFGYKKLKVLF